MGSGSNNDDSLAKLMGGPAAGGSIIQWFDAVLAAIEGSVQGGTAPTYPPPPPRDQNDEAISEIERQLFLQFLMGELRFIKTHRIMKANSIFIHIEHDRMVCENRQKKISQALSKLGSDAASKSVLNSERGQTIVALLAMELQEKEAAMAMISLDEFLDNREEGIVRRILTRLLDDYNDQSSDFDAHSAWIDLAGRWASWATSRTKRGHALRQLWAATGGGKDFGSAPAEAYAALNAYYKSIYQRLESRGVAAFFALD